MSSIVINRIRKVLLIMLSCALLVLSLNTAFSSNFMHAWAVADNSSTANSAQSAIRVGYYEDDAQFQTGADETQRKSGFAYDYLQALAAVNQWTFEYVYGTRDELIQDLQNGDIDLIAGVFPSDINPGGALLSEIDMGLEGEPRYFAVSTNNPEIMSKLDAAQERILRTSPQFLSNLSSKYYVSEAASTELTDAQKQWIEKKGLLRLGYTKDNLPISGQSDSGTPIGVTAVLIQHIEDLLGIPVEAVAYDSAQDAVDALKTGEVDIAFPVYYDLWASEINDVTQTNQVVSDRALIVSEKTYSENITDSIGIFKDGLQQDIFVKEYFPNSKITEYDSRGAALEGLRKGEVTCVVGCASVLQRYLTEHDEYDDEFSVAFIDYEEAFSMAVARNAGMLAGILNKVVNSIDSFSVTSTLVEYASPEGSYSIMGFIRQNLVLVLGILLVFIALLVLAFALYYRRSKQFNKEQERARIALEAALDSASAANAAKSTFLTSMSHDIHTPMNGIIGMTNLAKQNLDDPQRARGYLDKVSASSVHLLELINDVLDMSKIESGESSLHESDIDINLIFNDVKTHMQKRCDEKGQQFHMDTNGLTHSLLRGDGPRIEQVFSNIISNAIKYTPEHGRIDVELNEVPSIDPKRICLQFVVQDNGIGMSEEYLPRLFDPFTREGASSATGGAEGTGLGMSIVQNYVRMMEGDIEVESELGKGTKITVTLFLAPADGSADDTTDSQTVDEDTKAAEQNHDFSNLHVLLVDDNELNAEIAMDMLESTGMSFERARTGKEALDIFKASQPGHFDCIFMDIQMPIMTGIEATKAIRALDREDAQTIPIFAMTADAFNDDILATQAAGMNEHFAKPLDFDLVRQTVAQYFSQNDAD